MPAVADRNGSALAGKKLSAYWPPRPPSAGWGGKLSPQSPSSINEGKRLIKKILKGRAVSDCLPRKKITFPLKLGSQSKQNNIFNLVTALGKRQFGFVS